MPPARYILLFTDVVIPWLKISAIGAVRRPLKLSWNGADNITQRAVKRGLGRRKRPQSARSLWVNEAALKRVISTSPLYQIFRVSPGGAPEKRE